MLTQAGFLYTVCQVGAEGALKAEFARRWPTFRFAFSRPGFVTFKLPPNVRLAADFDPEATFARASGISLGKVVGDNAAQLAAQVWERAQGVAPHHLHVWQRDSAEPGHHDFEPGPTLLADDVGQQIVAARSAASSGALAGLPLNHTANPGDCVLDCVLVEPNEWWLGVHQATSPATCWTGGVPTIAEPAEMVSRAYLKMVEGLWWSRLPIKSGDHCAEIGCAPGGAAQALLERGLSVVGIDPAEMDERILAHPNFVHVRKRAADMKRREFRQIKWLFADSNVAPQCTLDSVEAIVTNREVPVRGLLLTLKLLDWSLAEHVGDYVERVRRWGFDDIVTRQLAFNRREFCLAGRKRRGGRSSG